MATAGKSKQQLTNKQIVRLAAAISANKMAAIAEGYMNIPSETIKNKKYENKDDAEAFNREVIRYWMSKNPQQQVPKLAQILYKAATENGYVDPKKVEEILKIKQARGGISHRRKAAEDGIDSDLQHVHQKLETLRVAAAIPAKPEVTISYILDLAENLRTYTAQAMKIEVAPWIKEYVTDMDNLYTELMLEKVDNMPHGPERVKLENYKELFPLENSNNSDDPFPSNIPRGNFSKKILFKGHPGIGKTTLSKKIAYDWAKGLFTSVSIVFFVYLKLVKPGEAIENAILWQNPILEGLHVTAAKLANILKRCGPECLLILDGLDECALGQNSEVLKIITGAKLSNCNVILTSRPHSTREFERYFNTIVSVEGFTRSEAAKFAHRIVKDEGRVEQILDFSPYGESERSPNYSSVKEEFAHKGAQRLRGKTEADYRSVHNVPILLSFLCLLVREENIDLSDKTIGMGEIYFRMVRCLYKKYTIRKGIEFNTGSFVEAMKSLGKVALEMLSSGNALLQRSQVIAEVGSDAFDYGLMIGHEDAHRLIRDETADIFVTFPHRSILQFLGAFHFVLRLGKDRTVNRLGEAVLEYFENPLFSQFCLWFLDESNKSFPFPERSVASDLLSGFIVENIDDSSIDSFELAKNFSALELALNVHNHVALGMLEKVLKECHKLKDLAISIKHPVEVILTSISDDVFESLKSIKILSEQTYENARHVITEYFTLLPEESPLYFFQSVTSNDLEIVIKGDLNSDLIDSVLNICAARKRSASVDLTRDDPDPLQFCKRIPALHKLILNGKEVSLTGDRGSLRTIGEANAEEKLPNLRVLDIRGTSVDGRLHMLLTGTFPSLTTLALSDCVLNTEDLANLAAANAEGKLPNLRVLDIRGMSGYGRLHMLLTGTFPSLTTLTLSDCVLNTEDLAAANAKGKLPNLRVLDIRGMSVYGRLHMLLTEIFSSLTTLILSDCVLNTEDLTSLVAASVAGKLPELRHLDISCSSSLESHSLNRSFCAAFPKLTTLIARRYHCNPLDAIDLHCLSEASGAGKLPHLTALDLTNNRIYGHLSDLLCQPWSSLNILILRGCWLNSDDMRSIASANALNKLPQLKLLDVSQNISISNRLELGYLPDLLSHKFPSLNYLILCKCLLIEKDLDTLAQAKLDGKLPAVKYIDVSFNDLTGHLDHLTRDPRTGRNVSWDKIVCAD